MATYVIYADAADGYVYAESTTYATARAGSGTKTAVAANPEIDVGQFKSTTTYYVYEGFLSFDTSGVAGTVSAATLSVYVFDDAATNAEFTMNARAYDWGASLTTADFVAGASLSANALRATLATSGIANNAYNDFTSEATFKDNVASPVRLVLSSSRQEFGTSDATNGFSDYIGFRSTDQSGTSNDPKLTIVAEVGVSASDTVSVSDTAAAVGKTLSVGAWSGALDPLSDTFTDTSGVALTAHDSRWTRTDGTDVSYVPKISASGRVYQDTNGSAAYFTQLTHAAAFADGDAEFTIVQVGPGDNTGGYIYLAVRRQADGANPYAAYLLGIDGGHLGHPGRLTLDRYKSGVYTTEATYDIPGYPGGSSTYTLRLLAVGARLRVQNWDGSAWTDWIDWTDSSPLTTSGVLGLEIASRGGAATSKGLHLDSLVVHNYGAMGQETATVTEGTPVVTDPSNVAKTASDTLTVADSAANAQTRHIVSTGFTASALSGWATKQAMRVTGNAGAQTNYPVSVDVTWRSGMKTDFGDVRFTAADGSTLLTYWKDAALLSTGVSARFYVTIPSLPASGSSVDIYMHYGNAGASYAGAARGANSIFGSYDGGAWGAIPRASSTGALVRGSSGAWDDRYITLQGAMVKNLDGTLYVDGDGYCWGVYNGANFARDATIDLTSPFDGNNAPGDDCPGFFKFLASDPSTLIKVSTSDPFLKWGSGTWDPSSGTTWDGRVVQQGHIFHDADGDVANPGEFICFYDGDAGPANVKEAYRQGVAIGVGANPGAATWTKKSTGNPSGQAWTFQHSGLNVGSADDMIAYAGAFLYDVSDSDPAKRWKQWYTGHTGSKWGIMGAYGATYDAISTRVQSTYVWQPRPSDGPYDGLIDWAFKLRGIIYIGYQVLGKDTDSDGRKKWAFYVGRSDDNGATWTLDGEFFNRSTTPGDWDYGRMQDHEVFYNPVTGKWNLAYTASATGNGAAGDDPAYVPDLKVAITEWTATPAYLSAEPTVTFLTGGDTISVSDSAAVTVGVGAITKTASDGFNVTDTSGGLAVTYWLSSGETVVVADGASSPNTTTVGLTASDVFYVSDASGTGVPSINRRPYWWLHRKRVSS